MTPDELWEKYHIKVGIGRPVVDRVEFYAALAEYGAAVRSQDVKVIAEKVGIRMAGLCAAEIEATPLP